MEGNGIVPTMPIGGSGLGSNDGIWLFALLILFGMGGFGGFGNRGVNGVATPQDVATVSAFNQLQDENSNIVATIGNARNDVVTAIKDSSYNNLAEIRSLEAVTSAGFANAQKCCCDTLRAIDGVNYNGALNTASINANTTAGIQKVLDALAQNKIEALQGRVNQLELQNAVAGVVRYPSQTTYCSGSNPFACGCGCNNGLI